MALNSHLSAVFETNLLTAAGLSPYYRLKYFDSRLSVSHCVMEEDGDMTLDMTSQPGGIAPKRPSASQSLVCDC